MEWLDDCSYRLKADDKDPALTTIDQELNNNGGILIELDEIKGKCFYFKASFIDKGETIVYEGKLCKK